MNVRELIAALNEYDPDMEVHFCYDYGDHWHTQVAPAVDVVLESAVKHSAYHDMPRVVYEEQPQDHEDDEITKVVLLS